MNPNGGAKRCHKHNNEQRKYLIDFMDHHREFATGRLIGYREKEKGEKLWNELTEELNCRGSMKKKVQWQKVWKDLKTRTKAKAISLKSTRLKTGNFPIDKTSLSKEDLTILGLIESPVTEGCMVPDSMPEEMVELTELRESNESVLSDPSCSTIEKHREIEEEPKAYTETPEESPESQLLFPAECIYTENDIDNPSLPQAKQQETAVVKLATRTVGRVRKKKRNQKHDVLNIMLRMQEKQNAILEKMSEAMVITAKNEAKRLNIEEQKLQIGRETCQALQAMADAMAGYSKEDMIYALMDVATMNTEWCHRFLNDADWDARRALKTVYRQLQIVEYTKREFWEMSRADKVNLPINLRAFYV